MKEVIQKLKDLTETEERGQVHAENHFTGLKIELDSVRAAIISAAAVSDAQRLSLAMRAEKLATAEARRRALAEKEARQEADEMRKAQLAAGAGGATGIDLSSFQPKEEKKGIVGTIVAAIAGVVTTVIGFIEAVKASRVFKLLKKRLGNLFKPGGALGKIGDLFRKGGRFSKIGEIFTKVSNFFKGFGSKLTPLFKKGSTLSKIAPLFKKIGDFFKTFGSKVGNLFKAGGSVAKAGGIFSKVFGVIGKLGGVLGRVFAPLGVILGAFAGIFDAVKAVQGEEGGLGDKVIAGITGFFQGFIGFAIGGLLDLGKDLLAWLLGVFGVPDEKLEGMKEFSVTDFLKDTIGNIFEGIKAFFKSAFDGMFEGFYLTEGNIFQKILGGIMGLITGWANGLLEGYSKIIDGIAGFFGNDEFSFKDWLMGTMLNIFNGIKDFFKGVIEKGKELISGMADKIVSIGDTIKGFIRDMLPDPDGKGLFGLAGKLLSKTGIYDFVGADTATGTDTKPVDNSVIIPPTAAVGEALNQAGSMTNSTNVTVVNNNGGNVTNTTTSSQTNNSSTASPPVLSGSALAM
tara:strand:- start:13671 stop:15383 length:1713 start_codon:yes stop_codon:yes gene_type:complete